MEEKKFDKIKYNAQYNKEHKQKFSTELDKEEMSIINEYLKKNNISKSEFVRSSFKALRNRQLKIENKKITNE